VPKFILLVYDDETTGPAPASDEMQALWDAYVRLDEEARAAGALIDSQPMAPTSTATTLRVRGGVASQVSGPAEKTATQLGGYYLIQCRDEAEALEWAAKIPGVHTGAVEVRRIVEGP
jgi:hypothetical protein